MPLTARQLRQLLTIEAISRVLYFTDVGKVIEGFRGGSLDT